LIRDENGDDGGTATLVLVATQEVAVSLAVVPVAAAVVEAVGVGWALWELTKDAKLPEHKIATPTSTLPVRNIPWPKLKTMPSSKVKDKTKVEQPMVVNMKGERNKTAKPEGTDNPFKKMKPDPKNDKRVILKDENGKDKSVAKPEGFNKYWNDKYNKK
jgi:hypothetical protein